MLLFLLEAESSSQSTLTATMATRGQESEVSKECGKEAIADGIGWVENVNMELRSLSSSVDVVTLRLTFIQLVPHIP